MADGASRRIKLNINKIKFIFQYLMINLNILSIGKESLLQHRNME